MSRLNVCVLASDPVTHAGVVAQLRAASEFVLVEASDGATGAQVTVVAADRVDDNVLSQAKTALRHGSAVVLIASHLDDKGVLAAIEAGVIGLVRRDDVTPRQLVAAIEAVGSGKADLPPDVLGRLLNYMGDVQRELLSPRGMSLDALGQRHLEVLRLVADGLDTTEIAARLSYSERTIKNIVHEVMIRLNARNRSQAVARAIRDGLI